MIDKKSLFIGLLIGICICLAAVLFSEPRAYATPLQGQPRYQITTPPDFQVRGVQAIFYGIDSITGDTFALCFNKDKRFYWKPILSGPPR